MKTITLRVSHGYQVEYDCQQGLVDAINSILLRHNGSTVSETSTGAYSYHAVRDSANIATLLAYDPHTGDMIRPTDPDVIARMIDEEQSRI